MKDWPNCRLSLELEGTYPIGNIYGIDATVHGAFSIEKPEVKQTKLANMPHYLPKNKTSRTPDWISCVSLNTIQQYIINDRLTISVYIDNDSPCFVQKRQNFSEPRILRIDNEKFSQFHDITMHVFEDEDGDLDLDLDGKVKGQNETQRSTGHQTFRGHKIILATASPWFENLFMSGMESRLGEVTIRGVDPEIFKRFLHYSYKQEIYIRSVSDALKLIKVADLLKFDEIRKDSFSYLQMRINSGNFWSIWKAADVYNCKTTQDMCQEFIKNNCPSVLGSPGWLTADYEYTLKALKIDSLPVAVEESVFFEAILDWREAAIERISNNGKKMTIGARKEENCPDSISDVTKHTTHDIKCTENSAQGKDTLADNMLVMVGDQTARIELDIIDRQFSTMVHCIRFTQMKKEYLADVVEAEKAVMKVTGIERSCISIHCIWW
ncbi:hypothetical protein CLU79DRAFT_254922 [Phycomyces nitens]|nr:hypothetical protein CLU79DRAFT_254922 [Phycomyces nitens]